MLSARGRDLSPVTGMPLAFVFTANTNLWAFLISNSNMALCYYVPKQCLGTKKVMFYLSTENEGRYNHVDLITMAVTKKIENGCQTLAVAGFQSFQHKR